MSAFGQGPDTSDMDGPEMVEDGDRRLREMEATLDDVVGLRDQTEGQDGDLAKLRCINDKIAAMQGFLRLSADALDSLDGAVRSGDRDEMEHQYGLSVIAWQRVQNLQSQANQCAGEIFTYTGDADSDFELDQSIPDATDTTVSTVSAQFVDQLVSDSPLPEATPFQ